MKKNIVRTRFGPLQINKRHRFSQPVLGSRTSPYLQSKLVLLGCEHVYGQVPAFVESLLGIKVNQSQVYRSCQRAAFVADKGVLDEPSTSLGEKLCAQEQTVYAMVDGSMLPTEQGWQEVKVGRVFAAQPFQAAHPATKKKPNWELSESEYVALRGNYEEFTAKFEQLFPSTSACRKVLITDGAIWMSKWLLQAYPWATHILDYYHLKQKLALAAQATANGKEWLQKQGNRLLGDPGRAIGFKYLSENFRRMVILKDTTQTKYHLHEALGT